jgi:hypothetical protein
MRPIPGMTFRAKRASLWASALRTTTKAVRITGPFALVLYHSGRMASDRIYP